MLKVQNNEVKTFEIHSKTTINKQLLLPLNQHTWCPYISPLKWRSLLLQLVVVQSTNRAMPAYFNFFWNFHIWLAATLFFIKRRHSMDHPNRDAFGKSKCVSVTCIVPH
jgi:hypothetical protein